MMNRARRLRSPLALIAASLLVLACSGGRPRSPPKPHVPNATVAAGEAETSSDTSGLDPRLESKLAEIERLHDWRSTVFGSRVPNPPVASRAKKLPKVGSFKASAVASIRAYHYRHGFSNAGSSERDERAPDPPYTRDGRLEGLVVPPEVVLSDDERDKVMELVRAAEAEEKAEKQKSASGSRLAPKLPVLRCAFDDHHVLVFVDAADVPIAKIFLSFRCGDLRAVPGVSFLGGGETKRLTDEEKMTLREILDRHGLGAWTYAESSELDEVSEYQERVYGHGRSITALGKEREARRDDRSSGVPPELTPKRARPLELERFCVWLRAEMSSRGAEDSERRVTGSFDCADGLSYAFQESHRGCDARDACDVPIGTMETCFRASFLKGKKELCEHGPARECEGLLKCLPYVDWRAP